MTRRAATLIELLVVLAILGVLAAVAVPAIPVPVRTAADSASNAQRRVRMDAIRRGAPATAAMPVGTGLRTVTAWPNGLVLAESAGATLRIRAGRSHATQ